MKNIDPTDKAFIAFIAVIALSGAVISFIHYGEKRATSEAAIKAGLVQQYDKDAKEMKWVKP